MSNYKLSVVIPTYNTGDSLIKLINSIKKQTIGFSNIEILIIDDNSTDPYFKQLLKEYDNKLTNCKVIFLDKNHKYPGTSRNIGLKIANSEFIIFADHDDTYQINAFQTLYTEITQNNADLVFSNYYKVFKDKKIPLDTLLNGENVLITDISNEERLLQLSPSIWTKLFRKDFLTQNNIYFLEEMLGEDLYVYIYALLLSSKTIYLDNFYSYNYYIRDSNEDKSTIHLRNKKIFESMIKGYYKLDELLITLNHDHYFSKIFQNHFIYWITSLIQSNLSNNEKKELFIQINPLLIKYIKLNGDFNEKLYDSLVQPILDEDFNKIIRKLKYFKFRRKIRNLL